MTRKDFEALAAILGRAWNRQDRGLPPLGTLDSDIMELCASSNPRFDPHRFGAAVWAARVPERKNGTRR